MKYIINTSNGYVKSIKTIGGELNEVTEYTTNESEARSFTKKSLTSMLVKSFFRYHGIKITIVEVQE